MPKQKNDSAPSPVKPGMPEPTTDTAEAAASKDEAAAESQVAAATSASDSPEATATSPVKHHAVGNQGMPEHTSDPNPSPAQSGATEPTSPQDDTSEPGATKDEAGAESQVPAAPSNTPENSLPLTTEESVRQPAEADDGGWFVPFIPQAPEPPAPKPAPKPKPSPLAALMDKWLRDNCPTLTPTDATPETASPAPPAAAVSDGVEATQPSETAGEPAEEPLPPPRVATAPELITWIKLCLLALTNLTGDAAELIPFWVISTWFARALTVCPCLVVTGPAYDASRVMHALKALCFGSALLAGFRRSHLKTLRGCTNLIWEPNLDKRMAALLSSLTDREFLVVEGGYTGCYSKPTAIYDAEDPETHRILNAIHIHLAPTNAEPAASHKRVQEMMKYLPVHLDQYSDENYDQVRCWTWTPRGLSSETATIATALGRGIVDAPELRKKLVALLETEDKQRQSELSNTTKAIVLEATWTLCREGQEYAYAREIAAAVNYLFEARGEATRLRAEHVGHTLKGLGLPTHRLSQSGNGLKFDKATVARIRELAAMYMLDVMEDTPAETENLHSSQTTEKK